MAEHLKDTFLEAVPRIDSDLASRRNDFVKYYVTMLGYLLQILSKHGFRNFLVMGVRKPDVVLRLRWGAI